MLVSTFIFSHPIYIFCIIQLILYIFPRGAVDFRVVIADEALIARIVQHFKQAIEGRRSYFSMEYLAEITEVNRFLGFSPFESEVSFNLRACITTFRKFLNISDDNWKRITKSAPARFELILQYSPILKLKSILLQSVCCRI